MGAGCPGDGRGLGGGPGVRSRGRRVGARSNNTEEARGGPVLEVGDATAVLGVGSTCMSGGQLLGSRGGCNATVICGGITSESLAGSGFRSGRFRYGGLGVA